MGACDNKDEWFWYKKLEGIVRNDGTYTNDLKNVMRHVIQKDTTIFTDSEGEFDGDFGMVQDDLPTITPEQRRPFK